MVPLFFFLLSLQRIWFRSSMDRMKDSGSFDWGSHPFLSECSVTTGSQSKTLNKCFSFI